MIQLLAGDARDVLPTLAADSVQTVVTSPPYYALRSYLPDGHADKHREIGSEATPDEYLATMVGVFREVKRVLRPDGTVWCNMGDSYSSGDMGRNDAGRDFTGGGGNILGSGNPGNRVTGRRSAKPKDLLMMPARLALALQADGWWLRSDIIWAKPNPMPESCRDRPTSAHEHVFLLTKRSRYFYDADAVREERTDIEDAKAFRGGCYVNDKPGKRTILGNDYVSINGGRNCRNVWTIATEAFSAAHFATFPSALAERCIRAGTSERGACSQCGAPWVRVVEKQAAHAGKSWHDHVADDVRGQRGGASAYKGADRKAYDEGYSVTTTGWQPSCRCDNISPCHNERQEPNGRGSPRGIDRRVGAAGGAAAPAQPVPCTVLDPFAGAGTTLLVADRLQRDAIGIELSPDYTRMAMQRCQDDAPLFTSFPPASDDTYDSGMRDLFRDAAD